MEGMMDSKMDEKKHDTMHWLCCWRPLSGIILWVAAAICLIFAWVAKDTVYLGYSGLGWYWNALVLGVLAIPMHSRRGWCKSHGSECGGGYCGMPGKKM